MAKLETDPKQNILAIDPGHPDQIITLAMLAGFDWA